MGGVRITEKSAVESGMFTIPEVLDATGGRIIQGKQEGPVYKGVSTDTRTIKEGDLFVALKGERFDGVLFLNEALKRGAAGAVIPVLGHRMPQTEEEEQLRRGKVIIGVNDTLSAFQGLARLHRNRFSLPVVAITGSNGKTTTKEMVAWILGRDHRILKSEANINNQIGVPQTLLRLSSLHEAAVVEMGISRPGELQTLARIAGPLVGLITNISPTHLETLTTVEGVAQAKSELLESLPADKGIAILNQDDPFINFLKERAPCRTVTFGLQAGADVAALDLDTSDPACTRFRLVAQASLRGILNEGMQGSETILETEVTLPVPGIHNVSNAAAAAAVALVLGRRLDQIKESLESFHPMDMRSQLFPWNEGVILNDAYNANPASMRAALVMLAQFNVPGKRIAVLGDMLELGEAGPQAHRMVGEQVAGLSEIRLIAVGSMARLIAEAAMARGMPATHVALCNDAASATAAVKEVAQKGDVVLVKGSRGIHLEQVVKGLLEN